jgi:threonine/homoserine/homoserine lactone efflux protein
VDQIQIYLPGILLAYSIFLVGVSSPGPNVLAIIGTSMNDGRRFGVSLALGVAAGSLTWGVLTALGLSALLSAYAPALMFIKITGGIYLLWLAKKAFKSAMSDYDLDTATSGTRQKPLYQYALSGYIIQMSNPKAALAWVATISVGLKAGAPIWVAFAIVFGIFILSILCHVLYALVFSVPFMVSAYGKARRYVQATLGVFFGIMGSALLLDSR